MDEQLRAEVLAFAKECIRRELPKLLEGTFAGMKEETVRDMEKLLAISRKCSEKVLLTQEETTGNSQQPQEPQLWYRNISYGDDAARASKPKRLAVYDKPDRSEATTSPHTMSFGDMLPVKSEHVLPNRDVWLQLGKGATASGMDIENKWVLAEFQDLGGQVFRQCAKLTGMEKKGRPQPEEYAGQDFGRMFTEGYDGHQDVALLSASGQAFWKPINITCLLRNVATSTVFEQGWANSLDAFDAWVPHYAVNVYRYGLAGSQKALCVTVKPTADWQTYAGPDGILANLDEVASDLGRAQKAECKWMVGAFQKLGFQWSDVRFFTAQSFLKRYGHWTVEDCASEALSQLNSVKKNFSKLDFEAMQSDLFAQIFSLEEAFDCSGGDLQDYLQIPRSDRGKSKRSGCGLPPHPSQRQPTESELQPLRAMRELWMERKKERDGVLTKFGLSNTNDADVLICRHALHLVAAEGLVEVAKAMVATLHASMHRSSCLMHLDTSGNGQTPLHVAAKTGHADVLSVFLREAVLNQQLPQLLLLQDKSSRTALGVAVRQDVKNLLAKEVRTLALSRLKTADLLRGTVAAVNTELKTAGFTSSELRVALPWRHVEGKQPEAPDPWLPFCDIWKAGYTASDLKGVDVSARKLWKAGYRAQALKNAGYPEDQVLAAGEGPSSETKWTSCNLWFQRVLTLFFTGDVKYFLWAGYSPQKIREAGYTVIDFERAGCSVQEIRAAGYTCKDLLVVGCPLDEIILGGYRKKDFQEAGCSVEEIKEAGCTFRHLAAGGK